MNLLDTASLVVTPNGYKTSKLYSIVPTDGTGDFTVTRTGDTATRINSSGFIEAVTASKPRLDYLDSTCPKVLLEPQRTNLQIYSNDFTNATYTKASLTVTSNSEISPDGATNAALITVSATTEALYSNITVSSSTTYTFSFYAKRGTRTAMKYSVRDNTNATNIADTSYYSLTNSSTWTRITYTFTTPANCTSVRIYPTRDSFSIGTCYIYGIQLEAGSYASSYIPTTTASVTRNVDSVTKSSASALIGQTEGVIFMDINLNTRIASTNLFVRNTAATNFIGFLIDNTKISAVVTDTSTAQASIDYTNSSTGRFKLAMAYKANDFVFYVNGTLIGTDTSGTVPACDIIDLYYNATNLVKINSSLLWKTRLSNSELSTLTTL